MNVTTSLSSPYASLNPQTPEQEQLQNSRRKISRLISCISCIPCLCVNLARGCTMDCCNDRTKIGRCWTIGMGGRRPKPQNRCDWFCQAISTHQMVDTIEVLTCGEGLDLEQIYEHPPSQRMA